MEIKKVSLNEIYWTIKAWNVEQQANNRIKELLGPELASYFAKCNVGVGFYSWTTLSGRWASIEEATAQEMSAIESQWEAVQAQVREKLAASPEMAERILEIPNKKYLYFSKDTDGTLNILVTGWGFRNFKRPHITPITKTQENKAHPVNVGFTHNGQQMPNRPFQVVAATKNNDFTTNADGIYSMGNIDNGKSITVIDGPTQKTFTFVVDDRIDYLFDVTEHATLTVTATKEGRPVDGRNVTVTYNGNTYNLNLVEGKATLPLIYDGDKECAAKLDDLSETIVLQKDDGNHIHFTLAPDVVVPDVITLTVLDAAGQPIVDRALTLKQGSKEVNGRLDQNGQTVFDEGIFAVETPLTVSVDNFADIVMELEKGEQEYVIQEQVITEKHNPWPEILMGTLLLLVLAAIAVGFYYGIDELSDIINNAIH